MFSWDEIGHGLCGRIKSVLILVMAALLTVQQAVGNSGKQNEEANPIDRYFAGEEAAASARPDAAANVYLDCWERELRNGYRLMSENGAWDGAGSYAVQAWEAFGGFAQAEGWAEVWLTAQEVTGERGGDKALKKALIQAELYRQQALRVYGLLEEPGTREWENLFLFEKVETERVFAER